MSRKNHKPQIETRYDEKKALEGFLTIVSHLAAIMPAEIDIEVRPENVIYRYIPRCGNMPPSCKVDKNSIRPFQEKITFTDAVEYITERIGRKKYDVSLDREKSRVTLTRIKPEWENIK